MYEQFNGKKKGVGLYGTLALTAYVLVLTLWQVAHNGRHAYISKLLTTFVPVIQGAVSTMGNVYIAQKGMFLTWFG